jgi:TonB family protein
MNCSRLNDILDERRLDTLSVQERLALERHLCACDDCADAMQAVAALEAETPPEMPPLVARKARAAFSTALSATTPATAAKTARRTRYSIGMAMLGAVLGGAVIAGLSIVEFSSDMTASSRAVTEGAGAEAAVASNEARGIDGSVSENELLMAVESLEREEQQRFGEQLLATGAAPDGDYFRLLSAAPVYPEAAASAGLEGSVVVEFSVTPEGSVTDVTVVESSRVVFEEASVAAVQQFKYKPRVIGGRAVEVEGVRNVIRFALEDPPVDAPAGETVPAEPVEAEMTWQEFNERFSEALGCLRDDDLLCIEVAIEEVLATRRLSPRLRSELARIEGFVNYRLGNYERAVEAYEKATEVPFISTTYAALPFMTLARIQYERGYYQSALEYAVQYLKRVPNPTVGDYTFVDRLRELGAVVR